MKQSLKLLVTTIVVCLLLFSLSCDREEPKINSTNLIKSGIDNVSIDDLIIHIKSPEIINVLNVFKEILKEENQGIAYFNILELEGHYIQYNLLVNTYTNETPYYLYYVITKEINTGEELSGFVKYFEKQDFENEGIDMKNYTGKIQLLNTNINVRGEAIFNNGGLINGIYDFNIDDSTPKSTNKSNNTKSITTCTTTMVVVTVPCSNGGGHLPGESCADGLVNDAYYSMNYFTDCFTQFDYYNGAEPPANLFFGGGSGSGGNNSVGTSKPVTRRVILPERFRIKSPKISAERQKIRNIMTTTLNNLTYRDYVRDLASSNYLSDPANEHGIYLRSDNNAILVTPAPSLTYGPIAAGLKYRTLSHIHNNPPGGTYSIFSSADLLGFAKFIASNEIDPADFVATLSTHKGTHYTLTISDPVKFSNFYKEILASQNGIPTGSTYQFMSDLLDKQKLIKKYFNETTSLIQENDPNNEDVLGFFLDFLKEADMGITLFETTPDVNNQNILFHDYWHVSKNGTTITRTLYN